MSYMTGFRPPDGYWYSRTPEPPPHPPFHKTTQFFVIAVLVGCAVYISLGCSVASVLFS
jgi:hypothetical protein